MLELTNGVYYIPGKNQSRFPYCACLYVRGTHMRVLIDAGMGAENLDPVLKMGIDLVLLTHCHIDHRLTSQKLNHIPFVCHEEEEIFIKDKTQFLKGIGLSRGGIDLSSLLKKADIFDLPLKRTLRDGETLDLGGMSLTALHTPGHTPGHLAFLIPERRLLFAGDIDLTTFGPFYGHDFADIDQFIQSIDKLKQIPVQTVASGHAGPFRKNFAEEFETYKRIIHHREDSILRSLEAPRTLESFRGLNFIYPSYGQDPKTMQWFELVHVEKHLKRLLSRGLVVQEGGRWKKT